jgi:hypothetical protein
MMLNNGFFSVCIYIYTICTCSSGFVWCNCPLSYISPLYKYTYIHIKYHVTNGSTTRTKTQRKKHVVFKTMYHSNLKCHTVPWPFGIVLSSPHLPVEPPHLNGWEPVIISPITGLIRQANVSKPFSLAYHHSPNCVIALNWDIHPIYDWALWLLTMIGFPHVHTAIQRGHHHFFGFLVGVQTCNCRLITTNPS